MNKSPPTIRNATVDDAERISRLLIDLSQRYVLPDLSPAGGEYFLGELAPARMRKRLKSGFAFDIAECGGKLAGVVAMNSPTHVYYLFVDTPFQRQGLARRLLMEATVEWRTSGGTEPLTVNASPFGVSAYRRIGFKPTGGRREKHGVAFYPMQISSPEDLAPCFD